MEKINDKNVLELCVSSEPWVSPDNCGDYNSVPKTELDNNSWWYLHGKLDLIVGYDKAYAINCKSAGYSKESINWSMISGDQVKELDGRGGKGEKMRWEMHVNGIIPVRVKGVDELCVGYFWTIEHSPVYYEGVAYPHWEQRGLVCLESDATGRAYALECMEEERQRL